MAKILKGDLTRRSILESARKVFNEKGILMTLDNLSVEIGITKGRVTNHFPTKEKLFLAILSDYEDRLKQLLIELSGKHESRNLGDVVEILSQVMDLQYMYRCCVVYLNVSSPGASDLSEHTRQNYLKNVEMIRRRISSMVKYGLLVPELMDEELWSSFLFVYVNQMTQWVIHLDMYDSEAGYPSMKPVYLRGLMTHVYGPYLTPKGRRELKALKFEDWA